MSDTEREGIEGDLGTCDRCCISDAENPIVTVVNGVEQKEWVCPGCEEGARKDEKPPVVLTADIDRPEEAPR